MPSFIYGMWRWMTNKTRHFYSIVFANLFVERFIPSTKNRNPKNLIRDFRLPFKVTLNCGIVKSIRYIYISENHRESFGLLRKRTFHGGQISVSASQYQPNVCFITTNLLWFSVYRKYFLNLLAKYTLRYVFTKRSLTAFRIVGSIKGIE